MSIFYEMDKDFGDLLNEKKNFLFIGEAGSGKSEIVLNVAAKLAEQTGAKVQVFDMDQSKPLYRSRDMKDAFAQKGVEINYQLQFLDAPIVVGGVAESLMNKDVYTILDIGGGHNASRVVGVYAHLLKDDDTVPVYVINPYRPWTKSLKAIDETMSDIVTAARLNRIYILGNPNLGYQTSAEEFMEGLARLDEMLGGIVTVGSFVVRDEIYDEVKGMTDRHLFPIELFLTYSWVDR